MQTQTTETKDPITKTLKTHGAFFAFNNKQFSEQSQSGITYVNLGNGLMCPKEHAKKLTQDLTQDYENEIAQDLARNGKQRIIKRELANHECYYVGDPTDAIEALENYGITAEEVWRIYHQELPKQDL